MKIAVTGPESSGKSTLSLVLSERLKSPLVPEFARVYVHNLNGEYNANDIDLIAKGQLNAIREAGNDFISDTDFVVLNIWLDFSLGTQSCYIDQLINEHHFDLHVLCSPDIPWEDDPLREHPNPADRERLFELYEERLNQFGKSYIVVSGSVEQRAVQVLRHLETHFK